MSSLLPYPGRSRNELSMMLQHENNGQEQAARMKIAFVHDAICPPLKAGVEKRKREPAVRLSARGHEVHIAGMKYRKDLFPLKMTG